MTNRWGNNGNSDRLYFWGGFKITADGDCSHEIKRRLLLGIKAMINLDSNVKKQRHYFANKGLSSKSYNFSSSHVWMWKLDHKEGWVPKNWCFWIVILEKTLESPLYCKEIKPVNPKQTSHSFEGLMLKLQYFGHPMRRDDSLEKTLMLWKTEGRRSGGVTEDKMVGWHHWLNGREFEQALGDSEGQGSLACCSPRGRKEVDMT